ncbi:uncharacterized protein BO88DRAFT_62038 [Aspergillus vadensis CBS 113365]|uniref:Secreted protein n=1 Tax=Aspergillus vadensis (strain CBS 113365 / IMI 142717 / IBT 24658) TaxID=1448311 RepID=A0A319BD35_ASPVC|nr:hypothetical protein BO88DRAFT_62038 [Aspergillus vadensis CBS 113365]PYH68630.1 hypothetical protein BO88DRAFT_62038 [Aspergillus vadensis CBS 113365]
MPQALGLTVSNHLPIRGMLAWLLHLLILILALVPTSTPSLCPQPLTAKAIQSLLPISHKHLLLLFVQYTLPPQTSSTTNHPDQGIYLSD